MSVPIVWIKLKCITKVGTFQKSKRLEISDDHPSVSYGRIPVC
jgi:hypothetical protein